MRRTRREWHPRTVGFSTPNDVRDLQTKVQAYHEQLLIALTNLRQGGQELPAGAFSQDAWDAMTKREEAFLAVSVNELNPLAWVDASTAFAQGRALVTELDTWRDELASLKAPGVPADPMPVPGSQTSFFGDIGTGLMLLVGLMLLHEFGGRR